LAALFVDLASERAPVLNSTLADKLPNLRACPIVEVMSEQIFDVVLQTTGHFRGDIHTSQENSPPQEDLALGEDFWVGRLPIN